MNSTNDTSNNPGTNLGEKIAAWAILLIIAYLFWNR